MSSTWGEWRSSTWGRGGHLHGRGEVICTGRGVLFIGEGGHLHGRRGGHLHREGGHLHWGGGSSPREEGEVIYTLEERSFTRGRVGHLHGGGHLHGEQPPPRRHLFREKTAPPLSPVEGEQTQRQQCYRLGILATRQFRLVGIAVPAVSPFRNIYHHPHCQGIGTAAPAVSLFRNSSTCSVRV